ncbi:MAG: aminotransferase class [Bacteroidetes bacterium]|nr:aminotransferase class [Bacteroidota bacterium]
MKTELKEFRQYVAQVGEIDPIMIDVQKAEGIYVWDTEGKEYIDMLSGICVGNIGHRNPRVIDAVKAQMDKYMHVMVYGEFVQSPQLEYAKYLMANLPKGFDQIFYVNSGSEAIEGALKTAKIFTKRTEVISFKNSYHGSTLGAVSMLSAEEFTEKFRPLIPDCRSIEYNNEEDLEKITTKTACVVAESIQAGAGVILPSNDFLKRLRQRCTEFGALLIMDEIQTGFGRSGRLFAFENYGIVPDILCIAKGMGGGMPIGAFVGSKEIMNSLNNHHPLIGHATTFGGHPLSCVAALETLKTIVEDKLMEGVEEKGELYKTLLVHPRIKEVRGIGLFNCMELKEDENNKEVDWSRVLINLFEEGIISGTHLFNSNCISIKPPLTITEEEIRESCSRILRALDKL